METAEEYILTLDLVPFIHTPQLPRQRPIVSVNDSVVGSAELVRPTLLGYHISAELTRRVARMVVILQHPDAAHPKDVSDSTDDRDFAVALSEAKLYRVTNLPRLHEIRLPSGLMLGSNRNRSFCTHARVDPFEWATARTGLSIPQIALKFEFLGKNCEFGLFQRRCCSEPLGLFRFSSTLSRNLIRGMDDKFDGLGEPGDIELRLEGGPPREYMIHEKKFGLIYHTFVYEGQCSLWLMREQESARLKFLRRKFIDELEAADKIFVYKFGSGVSEEEILPLHLAVNRYSEAILLWVVPAERDRPVGTVEVVMPGLLKGYIDRFAPDDNAHDVSFDGWLQMCANACVLARLRRPAALDPQPDTLDDSNKDDDQGQDIQHHHAQELGAPDRDAAGHVGGLEDLL